MQGIRYNIVPPTTSEVKQTFTPAYVATSGFNHSYDAKNRKEFVGSANFTTLNIIVGDEEAHVQTTIYNGALPANHFGLVYLCCAPRESKICYTLVDTTTTSILNIWVINYNGTGNTSLFNFPKLSSESGQNAEFARLIYNQHRQEFCFGVSHQRSSPLRTTRRLYTFTSSATSPTVIYDQTDNDNSLATLRGDIKALCYDGINRKILFLDTKYDGVSALTRAIKRCDFDGGNLETLVNLGTTGFTKVDPRISYRDECLYTWDVKGLQSTDTVGGLFKRDFMYNQITKIVDRKTFDRDFAFGIDLGCGFEKVGPTYKGF